MVDPTLERLAEDLSRLSRSDDLPRLSLERPELTLDEAYIVQRLHAQLRAAAGDRTAGRKIAMVSAKRQREVGATEPVSGRLFESGRLESGGDIRTVAGPSARVECELAFVIGQDLHGPDIAEADVIAATSRILPAFEIVERRFPTDATIADRIAVNYAAAGFVLGTNDLDPRDVDRTDTRMEFVLDGEVVATAPLGSVLGDPARSVAWLVNRLAALGEGLHPGDVILSGTIVPAIAADEAHTFRAVFGGGLGSVEMTGLRPAA